MATYPGGSLRLEQGDTQDVSEGSLAREMHWANVDSPGCLRGLASAGQQTRQVFCTVDDAELSEHLCQPQPRPARLQPAALPTNQAVRPCLPLSPGLGPKLFGGKWVEALSCFRCWEKQEAGGS